MCDIHVTFYLYRYWSHEINDLFVYLNDLPKPRVQLFKLLLQKMLPYVFHFLETSFFSSQQERAQMFIKSCSFPWETQSIITFHNYPPLPITALFTLWTCCSGAVLFRAVKFSSAYLNNINPIKSDSDNVISYDTVLSKFLAYAVV